MNPRVSKMTPQINQLTRNIHKAPSKESRQNSQERESKNLPAELNRFELGQVNQIRDFRHMKQGIPNHAPNSTKDSFPQVVNNIISTSDFNTKKHSSNRSSKGCSDSTSDSSSKYLMSDRDALIGFYISQFSNIRSFRHLISYNSRNMHKRSFFADAQSSS